VIKLIISLKERWKEQRWLDKVLIVITIVVYICLLIIPMRWGDSYALHIFFVGAPLCSSFLIGRYVRNTLSDDFTKRGKLDVAFKWLEDKSKVIRTKQRLTITLTSNYNEVNNKGVPRKKSSKIYIKREYDFKLLNRHDAPQAHKLEYVTELGSFGEAKEDDGFVRVKIGNEPLLTGLKLADCVTYSASDSKKNTKTFNKFISLSKKGEMSVQFETKGTYRVDDRITWKFSDFCEGLTLNIINNMGDPKLRFYVNILHREEMHEKMKMEEDYSFYAFETKECIIPYEGFVIRFERDGKHANT